jgi:hypothetical protein
MEEPGEEAGEVVGTGAVGAQEGEGGEAVEIDEGETALDEPEVVALSVAEAET